MSSGSINPFQPVSTTAIAASTASANAALPVAGDVVLVTNTTAALAYVKFGTDTSLQASPSDTPVLPSSHVLLKCGHLTTYCASILASGSGAVLFTRGNGSFI